MRNKPKHGMRRTRVYRIWCWMLGRCRYANGHYGRRGITVCERWLIMIAAPFENEPQKRGGTWATIGMARRALKAGTLGKLYVVGRGGELLRHEEWK